MAVRCYLILAFFAATTGQAPEKRRAGNVCHVDMDCPDNAFCRQNSYCDCKDGFVYAALNATHKGCLKVARYGESCMQHVQCHTTMGVHAECFLGSCTCRTTAHLEDERCYETAVVGERCVVNQNCYLGGKSPEKQAFCVRGYCTCQLQYSPRDNGTRCVRDAALDEPCEDQLQCAGAGLECRGTPGVPNAFLSPGSLSTYGTFYTPGTCRCRDGWLPYNLTRSCLEAVKTLGEWCEYDAQCALLSGTPGAAQCLGGVCACSYSSHPAGTPLRCWHRRRPGQDCHRDEECVSEEDEPGYCVAGRCTCSTCVPDARDFGGACAMRAPTFFAAILVAAAILSD